MITKACNGMYQHRGVPPHLALCHASQGTGGGHNGDNSGGGKGIWGHMPRCGGRGVSVVSDCFFICKLFHSWLRCTT